MNSDSTDQDIQNQPNSDSADSGTADTVDSGTADLENVSENATSKEDASDPDTLRSGSRVDSFLTVGIGASAGGLEAFQTFFRHMSENSGMAFVLISHLAPDHDSLLSELLAKETQMPVLQVREETQLQPDRVYVIPPNATLTVDTGILRLSAPVQARGHRAPIDIFFRSLAEDQGENAVCIVLSGTGSDGTIGLKSIKEFNGLAIAQDSQSAKYDSMPRNAVMTGLVDYVLPVEEIPAQLIEYARHREGLRANLGEDGMLPQAADSLSQICALLRRRLGHDFSGYKQGTLVRRIQRRIQITHNASVDSYITYLKADDEEIQLLFKDLLIGVTHFFRDPEAFDALQKTVIAPLVKSSGPDKTIRIWIAGCSSGEEAYSIAMLVAEEIERQNVRSQVQIFATDIDDRALEQARHARYPESIADQILPERLERFFVKQNGLYQVSKQLREMCIFSQHSLISDPPFSRLDLISCRNLLIYFDAELQKRLIPLFHYALREDGCLFLGSSENLFEYGELFRTLSKPFRLFQHKQTMVLPQVSFPLVDRSAYRQLSQTRVKPDVGYQNQISRSVERVLLNDYAPACIIINEQSEIVYFFGRTGRYLEPSQGVPSNNLFDLARLGLRMDLRAAIRVARATLTEVIRKGISIENEERTTTIDLTVRPVKDASEDSGLLMVVFQDIDPATIAEQSSARIIGSNEEKTVTDQLEEELRITKEQLRSTVEEIETSNEELKSANEELLSMNEELQSSNEELQTSKEEMQSINEELETVNAELRNKVEELDSANSDVQNLFESTKIATVFLDHNLRIKRFTPATTELFHLIGTDIGRPVVDIAMPIENNSIEADVREVLRSLIPIQREIRLIGKGSYYNMRIMPYRTLENVISGVVVTFVDITSLRQSKNNAEEAARRQSAIAELGSYALQNNSAAEVCERATQIVCDTLESDLCSLFVVQPDNPEVLRLQNGSGWPDDSIGTATISATDSHFGYTLSSGQPVAVHNFSEESRFSPSELLQQFSIVSGISAIIHGTDRSYGVLTSHYTEPNQYTAGDISFLQAITNALGATLQRERTTQALAKSSERLDLALDAGNMGVWELDVATGLSTWNRIEYELLGHDPDESYITDESLFYRYVHPDDIATVQADLKQAIARKTEFNSEFRIVLGEDQCRWLAAKARVFANELGSATKVVGVNYDITERKQNEEALKATDRRKDDFLAALGHELRNPLNALSSSISLMQTAPAAQAEVLHDMASRQLNQLTCLVNDLLDVSRIAYQKIQLRRQPMDLIKPLTGIAEDYQEPAEQKGIRFSVSLPPAPVWINGDAVRLTQAFSNVLRNAIKFSDSGDRITLSATVEEGLIAIKITDTGIGIEADAIASIFTPFNQEDRSLARSGGLGLGLPLAKGIVELHGGQIWADSAGIGQGTEVTIMLHCLIDAALTQQSPSAIDASPANLSGLDRSPKRILIIEDNEDSALVAQFFLEGLGHTVEIASNGQEGLAIARQTKPDIIISDIGLTAEMDGYGVAQAVRADRAIGNTYLIAASGYGQPKDKAKAKEAGFNEHFTKPINLYQLEQSVRSVST